MALRLSGRGRAIADGGDESPGESGAPQPSRRGNRTLVMLVLVLGVAGVALLVMEQRDVPPDVPLPTPGLAGEPDIYVESPDVSQYTAEGFLEYRLTAADASHYQPLALTRLSRPELTLFRPDGAPWHVAARRGTLRRPPVDGASTAPDAVAEETVTLEDDVTLEQIRGNGEHVRLATAFLELYPRRQYARTDRDVMIESSFGRTTASGLEGDLRAGVLELESGPRSRVQTVLQPEQFKQ